ncbi:MAG: radical SAM protein [Nanoarchaeota archaeon]|nr:radical SAM protein [Nanoarchaeota archaeon]
MAASAIQNNVLMLNSGPGLDLNNYFDSIKLKLRMKKIFIRNVGCDRRGLDAARLSEYFRKNNCEIITDPEYADDIILVTCGFIESREKRSLESIEKLNRYDGRLIVLGCLPETSKKKLREIFSGSSLPTKNIDEIDSFFPSFKVSFGSIADANNPYWDNLSEMSGLSPEEVKGLYRDTATLRIASGCNGKCSYCIIPVAIGEFRSKNVSQIEKEYLKLQNKGYHNFIITADDTGAYGRDIGLSLSELLIRLDKLSADDDLTWEICTLNPCWINDAEEVLFMLIKRGRIRRLEIDIQSGSSRILHLMNRPADLKSLTRTILRFKSANPVLSLKSQFIIGFPTESEKDFEDTIDFIKNSTLNCKGDILQIIPYSDMPGSVAHKIHDKNGRAEIARKYEILKRTFSIGSY